ncbi:MAG: 50S ribosomal protein L25 [Dehalococcoidales bacterium]|nr:50S ribosomal protein L25 [Dehalococcoidales bacterium]
MGIELTCKTREVLGKKVAALRRQGIVPVHLFGHGMDSLSLECDSTELKGVLAQSGGTRLIDMKVDKAKSKKVLVRGVQRNPIKGDLLHVDFYQVNMEEKVKLEIPIHFTGEAPALKNVKGTVLAHEITHLNVECLPDAIPDRIDVELSSLINEGDAIHVKDITAPAGATIVDLPEQLVARVSVPKVKEEVKPEVAAEAAAPVEGAEGEKAVAPEAGKTE